MRTVGDLVRHRAGALGLDLGHLDDTELGSRLASMPLDLADEPTGAGVALWLTWGTRDGAGDEGRAVGQFTSHGHR